MWQQCGTGLVYIVYGHEREYKVLLAKRPDRAQIEAWKRGVVLEDGYKIKPLQVRYYDPRAKVRGCGSS